MTMCCKSGGRYGLINRVNFVCKINGIVTVYVYVYWQIIRIGVLCGSDLALNSLAITAARSFDVGVASEMLC